MITDKKVVALIPARGGSKGLPGKNIKLFAGKPLLAWSIEAARKSRYVDRIIVSTDHVETADLARQFGAEVPFMRPAELADDTTRGIDVVLHALDELKDTMQAEDLLLLLQPTSPLRTAADIDAAIERLLEKEARVVISVCEAEHPPSWANTLPADECMRDFVHRDVKNRNRQELGTYYRLNGAIYLGYCEELRVKKDFFVERTFAYVMPRERSVDIDTQEDFRFGEFLFQEREERSP